MQVDEQSADLNNLQVLQARAQAEGRACGRSYHADEKDGKQDGDLAVRNRRNKT
jgi:hypothetical protein